MKKHRTPVFLSAFIYPGLGQLSQRRWVPAILYLVFCSLFVFRFAFFLLAGIYHSCLAAWNNPETPLLLLLAPMASSKIIISFDLTMLVYAINLADILWASRHPRPPPLPPTSRLLLVAALLAGLAPSANAGSMVIDSCSYADAGKAQTAWRAITAAPLVRPGSADAGGLVFPCPFKSDVPRVCWDRIVPLNLSRFTSINIDMACDNPHAVRTFNIYLKSGEGWYVSTTTLAEPGRRILSFPIQSFTAEGRTAGWARIERIRLSAWRGLPENTDLRVFSIRANTDSILLVQSTRSSTSQDEKIFSQRIAKRLSSWLAAEGVPHGLVTDDDVIRGILSGARVAVLVCHPHPPREEIAALRKFVSEGGRLIVFYSADPALAELMHVRPGTYKHTDIPGQWSSFVFHDPKAWHVPPRVYQESANIWTVEPADPSTRVIADWESSTGQRTGDPAWLAGPNGLWMTHILMDDDSWGKRNMLVGLLGHYDAGVWPIAARSRLNRIGRIDSYGSFAQAETGITALAASSVYSGFVKQNIAQAKTLYEQANALITAQRYTESIEPSDRSRQLLVDAYSRVQHSVAGEFRGVWDHNGTGWYPGDWPRTCKTLAEHGITAIFPNMLWGGLAHYPSKVLPESYTSRHYGDQIAQCLEAAKKYGLQVHVWKVCWSLSGAPKDFVLAMTRARRVQVNARGQPSPWLCPSHPLNVASELDSIKEVASRYAVDGIHLDYVRFAGADYCFCPTCRKSFEKYAGRRIGGWPQSVLNGGRYADLFHRWRAAQITGFVRQVREQVKAINPAIRLSAAVWSSYPGCITSVGQDWSDWLAKGYLDFVCPMNYTADSSHFTTMVFNELNQPGARGKIIPGIGVTSDESQLRPDQVIEQILATRRLGGRGFMLFDLSLALRDEVLPALKWGATSAK